MFVSLCFIVCLFQCARCCRRSNEECDAQNSSKIRSDNPSFFPATVSTDQYMCSRYLRHFGNCKQQDVLKCLEYYYCDNNNYCRSCYVDGTVCASHRSKGDVCDDVLFATSIASALPKGYINWMHSGLGVDMFHFLNRYANTICTYSKPLQLAMGFAQRLVSKGIPVGWQANSYLGMFLLSLATALAPGHWKPNLKAFPGNFKEILGRYARHALLTRADLQTHVRYSVDMQAGVDTQRSIDKDWVSAAPNIFERMSGESVLSFLSAVDGGLNGQELVRDDNKILKLIDTVLIGYIQTGSLSHFTDVELGNKRLELLSLFRSYYDRMKEPVLMMYAINPRAQPSVSDYVVLSGIFGQVLEEDERKMYGGYASWTAPGYDDILTKKILRYNQELQFAPRIDSLTYPQLRISPVTFRSSNHALAVPFYKDCPQEKLWRDLRNLMESMFPSRDAGNQSAENFGSCKEEALGRVRYVQWATVTDPASGNQREQCVCAMIDRYGVRTPCSQQETGKHRQREMRSDGSEGGGRGGKRGRGKGRRRSDTDGGGGHPDPNGVKGSGGHGGSGKGMRKSYTVGGGGGGGGFPPPNGTKVSGETAPWW
eukprot:TRINITY_DN9565_c3_g1_i2.p1 TRINITY_DN9565_c3_g1~~TRINITY_DN9565_c3_g1_i2.p1  ORF type:complete len:597 (-),score=45.32 TRINITY_DN9565_c3_g1_i2:318-2108(-)